MKDDGVFGRDSLKCQRIQVDEIWSFCYAKEKNVPKPLQGKFGFGDIWTWVALDADSKLVPCWLVGRRDSRSAHCFVADLAARLTSRIQLTSDGHRQYVTAVPDAFGADIDFAQLEKYFGVAPDTDRRYSPAVCIGTRAMPRIGHPDPDHISTSYAERQNLTMRMSMRRFTRLTNAFSKKVRNLAAAVALYYMHYNFCRIHQSLRITPAMAAGVSDHVWELDEIVDLLQ
jgi:IS1 family transposase